MSFKEENLLFIDTETGGIDPNKHSLLSIGYVVWNINDGVINSKEFFIKHSRYVFTKEAQKINKFNKVEHEKKALSSKDILEDMLNFIYLYFDQKDLIPIAGHNTQFDVSFMKKFLKSNGRSFNSIFSHRIIDTYSIIKYLKDTGLIDKDISSSAQAFNYFGIKVDGRHSALGDAVATAKLYEKMIMLIKK